MRRSRVVGHTSDWHSTSSRRSSRCESTARAAAAASPVSTRPPVVVVAALSSLVERASSTSSTARGVKKCQASPSSHAPSSARTPTSQLTARSPSRPHSPPRHRSSFSEKEMSDSASERHSVTAAVSDGRRASVAAAVSDDDAKESASTDSTDDAATVARTACVRVSTCDVTRRLATHASVSRHVDAAVRGSDDNSARELVSSSVSACASARSASTVRSASLSECTVAMCAGRDSERDTHSAVKWEGSRGGWSGSGSRRTSGARSSSSSSGNVRCCGRRVELLPRSTATGTTGGATVAFSPTSLPCRTACSWLATRTAMASRTARTSGRSSTGDTDSATTTR
mmetsp:Transcript_615/g.1899  ORF Transcript_615/g.1899 Transcript_615/m.1899 type:complete len:342 (-) Transcript_615:843-1868(-)